MGRIALPPFENLTGDPAHDWIGRAAPVVLRYQLRAAPGVQPLVIENARDARSVSGVRVLHGYYWSSKGRMELHAVLADGATGRNLFSTAASGGVAGACLEIARRIAPSAQRFATSSEEALRMQTEALAMKDAQASRAALEKALAIDPGFGTAYLFLMRSLAGEGDTRGALAAAARAAAQGTRIDAIDRLEIGIFASALRGDDAERRRLLGELARRTPGDAGLMRTIADAELRARRWGLAVDWLKRAAAAEPDFAPGWNLLAYVQAYSGDRAGAFESVERYRQADPDGANPLDSAGEIHFFFGGFDEAAKSFLEADGKERGFLAGGALFKASYARLMLGDRHGADDIFERFLQTRGELGDPLVPIRRAQWEVETGRRTEAFARLSALIEQERGRNRDAAAYAAAQLALWRTQMGERAKGRELAAAAGRHAQSPPARMLAQLAGFFAQERAPAQEWRARAAREFPGPPLEPVRQTALGYAFLYDGHFSEAAEHFRRRFEQAPDSILRQVSLYYAWALQESGKNAEAARLLATWAVPDPRAEGWFASLVFPRSLLLHARALEAQGKAAEAARLADLFRRYAGDRPEMFGGR